MAHFKIMAAALLSVGCISMAQAEERSFHGPAMFGLNGPVKEVLKTSPSDEASASTVETVDMRFKPNGQLENESCRYNEAGYPVSVKIDDPNFNGTVMVEYSADNRCSRYVMEIDKPMAMTITTTNEYRDGKLEYSTLTPQLKDPALADMIPGGMPPFNLEYSNVEYDSHGNWVKRDLKMIFPDIANVKMDIPTYTETRTITYY